MKHTIHCISLYFLLTHSSLFEIKVLPHESYLLHAATCSVSLIICLVSWEPSWVLCPFCYGVPELHSLINTDLFSDIAVFLILFSIHFLKGIDLLFFFFFFFDRYCTEMLTELSVTTLRFYYCMVTIKSEAVILHIGISFSSPSCIFLCLMTHWPPSISAVSLIRSFTSQPSHFMSWISQCHVHTVSLRLQSLFEVIYECLNSAGGSSNSCETPLVTSLIRCNCYPFTAFSFLNFN